MPGTPCSPFSPGLPGSPAGPTAPSVNENVAYLSGRGLIRDQQVAARLEPGRRDAHLRWCDLLHVQLAQAGEQAQAGGEGAAPDRELTVGRIETHAEQVNGLSPRRRGGDQDQRECEQDDRGNPVERVANHVTHLRLQEECFRGGEEVPLTEAVFPLRGGHRASVIARPRPTRTAPLQPIRSNEREWKNAIAERKNLYRASVRSNITVSRGAPGS